MAESKPYVASDKINTAIGFPGELAEGWEQRAIAKMGELLGKYRSLQVYMDACVHCGACSDKCHYFLGTGDPKNMPVARQDLTDITWDDQVYFWWGDRAAVVLRYRHDSART